MCIEGRQICSINRTYINIKSQDWVLLAVSLEARDLGLELVVLLLSLRTCPMVSLRLLARRRRLLLSLVWLWLLGRILGSFLRWLRVVAILGRGRRPALRIVVAHVAILL